ncbi:hypothetical protein, conserved [Entamoeba dispar SAW760]|uniref:Uncharacterized protein n=1 Tax=Entamoeba dispar (strain ATCC PRA-260 / SAW760) TaxID=370354 RepID=B0E7C0_ENTDS|nr:uncharacterized protein EDI_332320 [Entamoeba dispar SAW760]EDR29568.1 hypothetical protein, conserved [Entamoeba dispar SAW760]|eukprot:EDR29568.1 hypothetical protein, conserved [Entamoeba dispar SAW760]
MEGELTLKICIVGDEKCGKTSLTRRFIGEEFKEEVEPFPENLITKEITYEGKKIILNLMDPLDDGTGTTASFYNHANCIIALFDLSNKDSLQNCKNWLSYGDRYVDNGYVKGVIGVKSDLEREVTKEEAEEVAKGLNCEYFEVSNKTGEGCTELYDTLLKELYEKFIAPTDKSNDKKSHKKEGKKEKGEKKKCVFL